MPHLFDPLKVGPITIPNRIVVSPMCQYSAHNGAATDWHLQHLSQMAISGAGLVMVEATGVEPQGRITLGCLGLYSDDTERALKRVMESIRTSIAPDTVFGIQLAHAGRKGSCKRPWEDRGSPLLEQEGAWKTVAPSPIPFDSGFSIPHEVTVEEIEVLVEHFVQAARRAERLGFQVIEIHSAHGYLLHQFLSPLSNHRQDEYGKDYYGRMKLGVEILSKVKRAVSSHIAVGARISGTDWAPNGLTLDDAVIYAKALQQHGADYVCVSSGALVPHVAIPVGPGYQVEFAERIKKEVPGLITRAVGMIRTPQEAEKIIVENRADCVALARAFLDEPRWGWRAADELGADILVPSQYDSVRSSKWKSPWNSSRV